MQKSAQEVLEEGTTKLLTVTSRPSFGLSDMELWYLFPPYYGGYFGRHLVHSHVSISLLLHTENRVLLID